MFSFLTDKFMGFCYFLERFRKDMHQMELESYVASRAKTVGDVDRLVKEYEIRSRMF